MVNCGCKLFTEASASWATVAATCLCHGSPVGEDQNTLRSNSRSSYQSHISASGKIKYGKNQIITRLYHQDHRDQYGITLIEGLSIFEPLLLCMESPFFLVVHLTCCLNFSDVTLLNGVNEYCFYNSVTNWAHGFIPTFDTGLKTSIRLALKKHGGAENTDYIWVNILYWDKPTKLSKTKVKYSKAEVLTPTYLCCLS